MAISTYAELQTAVGNWLDRDDLTARIPEFIDMAESYINDDLRCREMITEGTINPSQVNKYISLPTGYLESIGMTDDLGEQLTQVHVDDLENMQYASSVGRPEFYSVTSRINFERVADSAYNFTFFYYKGLDIATDLTNAILTRYPNIYLYATLIQAEPFLKNEKRVNTWVQLYDAAVKKANNRASESLKKLRSDHPGVGSTFNIIRGY